MVETDLLRGHWELEKRPPDFAAAREIYTRVRELARQCGDPVLEGDCLRALAITAVGLEAVDAPGACRNAIGQLYEIRNWLRIWQVFNSAGMLLASSGKIEAAALMVGFRRADRLEFAIEHQLGFSERTLEILRSDTRCDEWMARGAAMERHEIVRYALAALQSSGA